MTRRRSFLALIPVLLAVAVTQFVVDRSTSVTFDELVLTSIGARWVATGDRGMVVDQPPLMPLLYGVALRAAGTRLPDEAGAVWDFDGRWSWGRALFFGVGNDPRRVATAGRAVAIGATALLLLLVWWIGTAAISPAGGLAAAVATAVHPEVITHGAIAYNDLPMALAFLAFLWAADRAVRSGGRRHAVLAGLALAVAFAVKFSAIACLPVGVALLALEGWRRRWDSGWVRRALGAVGIVGIAFWAGTALLYGGDWSLTGLRLGFWITVERALEGHPAPAWLFGATSEDGFRLFFPVAWAVKTPVGLLLATGVGLVLVALRLRGRPLRELAASELRAPLLGLLVFGAFLIRSSQNVGFRYALPVIPLLTLLAVAGWAGAGRGPRARRGRAAGLALLLGLAAGSVLARLPFVLSYQSEWTTIVDGPPALLDSSVDWGQGLLALRGWMEANEVPVVRLGFFGSALPGGYGIEYLAGPSFLPLPPGDGAAGAGGAGVYAGAPPPPEPEWTAVSLTNLHGLYFGGRDPYAELRTREPDAVVGGSILIFHTPRSPSGP